MSTETIGSWWQLWHPRYRRRLVELLVISGLIGGLVYCENAALAGMTRAITLVEEHPFPALADRIPLGTGLQAAFIVLAAFALFRVMRAISAYVQTRREGAFAGRARADIESTVLANLLLKDDQFFASKPAAEIVGRLSADIGRVASRRRLTSMRSRSVCMLIGNFYFFLVEDWRLAVIGGLCVGSVAALVHRMTKPVQEMDRAYLKADDRVKASFADLLSAAPEIQVGNLGTVARDRFHRHQQSRATAFRRYTRLEAVLNATRIVGSLLSLVALLLVGFLHTAGGSLTAAAVLLPVILKALPELFAEASAVVFQGLAIRRAKTSMERLTEYEAGATSAGDEALANEAEALNDEVVFDEVTHRYAGPDGTAQGGIAEVATRLEPGSWTAVIGPAGSGKSTFINLLLGRLQPQSGSVQLGGRSLADLSAASRAAWFAFMPQKPAVLDASIRENLMFSRHGVRNDRLSDDDLGVMEELGLGALCRRKALDMTPSPSAAATLQPSIEQMRVDVRQLLSSRDSPVSTYESGAPDPRHWVLEGLMGAAIHRETAADRLLHARAFKSWAESSASDLIDALAGFGLAVIQEQRKLLELDSFAAYSSLAPAPVLEPVWELRRAVWRRREGHKARNIDRLRVGLMASVLEFDDSGSTSTVRELTSRFETDLRRLRDSLADATQPFELGKVSTRLNWRENLVFGVCEAPNQRAADRIDALLLEYAAEHGLTDELTRTGLEFHVGGGGGRLSGGQRQLLALCRTALRRAPITVLDEPTSALDPANRRRVAELLGRSHDGRILVTVSHDTDLIRHADQVRLFEGGRLAGSGTFAELERGSELFRETLHLRS